MRFPVQRNDILNALDYFCNEKLGNYAAERNFDVGQPHSNVSNLSPLIRRRIISEHEVLAAALKKYKASKIEKFIQEVFWRTYWRGWLELHPSVYQTVNEEQSGVTPPKKTGIKCFDHWTEELIETGYLHNHARMWYASIWIFTLNKSWVAGANFFKRNLLDWCPASNTLGWRWVAGLQTIGKHYVAKAENIKFFTKNRFNPVNQLNETPIPIENEPSAYGIKDFYPPSTLELRINDSVGLVLTQEDLSMNTLFETKKIEMEYGIFIEEESKNKKSKVVNSFDKMVMEETISQLAGIKILNTYNEILYWAKNTKLNKVIFPYETIGNELLNKRELIDKLSEAKIESIFFMREWDRSAFPFANKGFFPFKKKIPYLLDVNNLT